MGAPVDSVKGPGIIPAPFLPDVLLRGLQAGLPQIAWMAVGASPGETRPEKLLFTFGAPFVHHDWRELDRRKQALPADEPFGCGFVLLLPYGPAEAFHGLQDNEASNRMLRVDACYIADLEHGSGSIAFSTEATAERRKEFTDAVTALVSVVPLRVDFGSSVQPHPGELLENTGELSRSEYEAKVLQIQEDILAGRYYELNFTQRFFVSSQRSPRELAALVFSEPAKHAAYIDLGNEWILSNSPELFLRVENRTVLTGPIKGTCSSERSAPFPIGGKDHAEHTMVLDMARNDLGRVCETGTVQVRNGYCIEHHRHLMHLVSAVEGRLRAKITTAELLQATFPAASITGAPKVEVLAAIREYEHSPRNLYTGAIGWCGNGYLELNVAIRTLLGKRAGGAYRYVLGSGGAVIADSSPSEEYEECLLKIRPLFRLLSPVSRTGLDTPR